ncbi:MAG: hypothetical protein ACOCXH_12675 [Cyclobacteriaceae bacterium]
MKKTLLLLFVLFYVNGFSQETFIYTTEGKTYLTYELSKILLHVSDTSPEMIESLHANRVLNEIALHYDFHEFEEIRWMVINIKPGKIASVGNLKSLLGELNRDSLKMNAFPFMRTKDGALLGIANRFNLKLQEKDNLKNHDKLFSSLGIVITDSVKLINKAYHGKIPHGEPISVINKLYESGLFEYIELDYLIKAERNQLPAPNDPYYNNQWAIPQMQVNNAWNLTRGENIKITVLDNGVDITHPDLIGNLHNNGFELPVPKHDFHIYQCITWGECAGKRPDLLYSLRIKRYIIIGLFWPVLELWLRIHDSISKPSRKLF